MNLENTTVIVANLGELKAYQVIKHEAVGEQNIKVSYSLTPLTDIEYIATHKKHKRLTPIGSGSLDTEAVKNITCKEKKRNEH